MSRRKANGPEEGLAVGGGLPPPELSKTDQYQLAELEKKFQAVRDFTGSVVRGLTTGF